MSASRRTWVVGIITQIVQDAPTTAASKTADIIVDRLMEEGVLHLGYGNAEVDLVVQKFTDTFGTTKVTKTDRFAAHRLVTRYGSQAVVGIVHLLGEHSAEKYAPVVGSITQLEDKWVSVMNFLRRNNDDREVMDG